nr:retrovirus-related Pol polyprotein from transposon TNT 1-94 [Tanacetum cinerariifolium]
MTNPEDITDPTTAMNMALALMAKAFKLNYSTPTNNNQRISSNPRNRQIAQLGMNMGQDRQMQMVGGNGENQNQVAQNPRVQNVGNQNGLIGVLGNGNQNGNGNLVAARAKGNGAEHNGNQIRCYNYRGVVHFARNCMVRPRRRDAAYLQTQLLIAQKKEAGIQLQAEESDLMAAAADLDEIKEVNANCILMANLQQASTSGTQTDKAHVYDSDGSTEVHDYENCDDNETFNMFTQEEQYTELLEPIPEQHQVPQNDNNVISEVTSVEQSGETVEQHPANFVETRALYDSLYQNLAIKVKKVNSVNHLNKQLSKEKLTVSFLLEEKKKLKSDFKTREDELLDKQIQLEKKIKELNNLLVKTVSVQKDNIRGTSKNTKFAKQPILGKPPMLGEIHALSKPNTSNSVPTPQESKVVKNDKVIAPGMFRINPFKTSREEKHVPNNVRASTRTKPITTSQPHVFIKKDVNFYSNGLSSTGIDNTKTRRPQPRSNTKNDRVPSASKSSRSKNKEVEVEEHHRNLLLSKNSKHMLSACNNFKLDSQNVYSKNSRGKKQTANDSIKEKQMKQKTKVKKPKKLRFIKRLAIPKPSKPRSLLRWSPTGRMFDLNGKIIASSKSESQSDCSKGDNACTSNPVEPIIKRCPNATFSFACNSNMFMMRRLGFFQAHDRKSKASHQFQMTLSQVFQSSDTIRNIFVLPTNVNCQYKWKVVCFGDCGRLLLLHVEAARTMLIFSRAPLFLWAKAIATACFTQNSSIIHRRFNKTPYKLINDRKPDISFLHVFEALCYPKNDREDIGKLGAKGDIAMAFEQLSSKPRLQSMTFGQISLGLDLTYALSTITTQQPTEGELDFLFEAMYDDYNGGQPLATARTVLAAQEPQVRQTSTASTSIADTTPTPTNSSSHATNFPINSQDVDELNSQQQHVQQQGNQTHL